MTAWKINYQSSSPQPNDQASSVVTDPSDASVYLVGATYSASTGYDILIVKYSPNGAISWSRTYSNAAGGDDFGIAAALDRSGNLDLTGIVTTPGGTYNIITMQYSGDGVQRWTSIYNGPKSDDDTPSGIVADDSGNVYVGGASMGNDGTLDAVLLKYSPTGASMWTRRYASSDGADDMPVGIARRGQRISLVGNTTDVNGFSRIFLRQYNTDGSQAWAGEYGSLKNEVNEALALSMDAEGALYVCGRYYDEITEYDYLTIAYTPNGSLRWSARYDGPGHANDEAYAVAADGDGNVYITGGSGAVNGTFDIATIKYDPAGHVEWLDRQASDADDIGYYLAIDRRGIVYIAGAAGGPGGSYDFSLLKYSPDGTVLWVTMIDGDNNSYDYPTGFILDGSANLYVCGNSNSGVTSAVVIKEEQLPAILSSTSLVQFDTVSIGLTSSQTIQLTNTGSIPAQVAPMPPAGNDFTILLSGGVIPPQDSISCEITFTPSAALYRVDSVAINGALNSPVRITLEGIGTGRTTVSYTVKPGWQLISLPVQPASPISDRGLFSYRNGYQAETTLVSGAGYWKKFSDSLVSYTGQGVSQESVHVNMQWNLIGSVTSPVAISSLQSSPNGIISGRVYGYTGGAYQPADTLLPGRGYWLKASAPGTVYIRK